MIKVGIDRQALALAGTGLFALFAAGPAWAQAVSSPTSLGTVTVVGQPSSQSMVTAAPEALPASTTVIGAEEIERRPLGHYVDIFRPVAGMIVSNFGQGGIGYGIGMRGFQTSQHGRDISYTVDGMPVNSVSNLHTPNYADLNFILPESIERVEVIRGPFSPEYGQANIAGAVNIVTKQSEAAPSVGVSGGSYGTARGLATFSQSGAVAGSGITPYLAAEAYHTDGYRSNSDWDRYNAMATHTDIESLHRDITVSRGTPVRANRVIEVVRRAFNLAMRWEWVEKNPASGQQRNPEEKRQRYLSPEELSRLSAALASHAEQVSADAIRMLMLTGARKSEVLGATWEMFNLDAGVWTKPSAHTKQRKEHRVPVSANALTLLKRIRETAVGPYVFPGKGGDQPLTDVKRSWAAVCKAADITGARIHDLRHSFASLLVSGGASLPIIGAMLGHTQVQTTQRYAHLYDEPLRAAADHVGKAIDMAGKKDLPEKDGKSG